MEAKAKMRTSEDVFNRLRWDEAQAGGEEVWIGYEDRLVGGPLEVRLSAFVPVSEGGDLPFHRIIYIRRGLQVVWDRRRRLDLVFQSGQTTAILAARHGQTPKGFNQAEDQEAARATQQAIEEARNNMAAAEEKRQQKLDQKQRRQQRGKVLKKMAAPQAGDCQEEAVEIVAGTCEAPAQCSPSLCVVTWNVLCDEHPADPDLPLGVRAPHIAAALREADPDVIAFQECGGRALLPALDDAGFGAFWRTEAVAGELMVLSRHPITRAVSLVLGPHKRALLVELNVQEQAVAIANVHFTSDRRGDESVDNSEKRAFQAQQVRAALVRSMGHAHHFVCGDFNEPGANGADDVAGHLLGLVDAWPSVHGDEEPGFTFDPARNRLADLSSLIKAPRRLDRVLAPRGWRPEAAQLLGGAAEASDHYGVSARLRRESPCLAPPVHTSSVALLMPRQTRPQIDRIRERFDPSFGRWMPHINLLYGFVEERHFGDVLPAIQAVVRRHDALELRFEEFTVFEHGRSCSLVMVPECSTQGGIESLQQDLEAAFPECTEQSSRGAFQPHLTLGKFDSPEEARHWRAQLQQEWQPLSFILEEIALLARPQDGPFRKCARAPLGPALGTQDRGLLELLEARSNARAYALGSAALLGAERPHDSDLDVLLVGRESREAVFRALEASMDAAWVRFADGIFPVLEMEVNGVHLDIQYAKSSSPLHPAFWPAAECEEGGSAAAALRDLHALRSVVLAARGLCGWRRFQAALLRVKAWAKLRGIYGNALGYLGGWSWAVLLAHALLVDESGGTAGCLVGAEDEDSSGEQLVAAMWRRFAEWPWPRPVMLSQDSPGVSSSAVMPILCPADIGANSARNVTQATLAVLRSELQFAAISTDIAAACDDFAQAHTLFVRCEVCVVGLELPVCTGFVEARLIVLIRGLDHLSVRPLKLAPGLWAMGLQAGPDAAAAAAPAVEKFRQLLSRSEWAGQVAVELEEWGSVAEALQRAQGQARSTPEVAPASSPPALERCISPSEVSPGQALDTLLGCPDDLLRLARGVLQRRGQEGRALSREAAVEVVGQLCRQCGVAEPPSERVGACFDRVAQGGPIAEEGLRVFLRAVLTAVSREVGAERRARGTGA